MNTQLIVPEGKQFVQKSVDLLAMANAIAITNNREYELACNFEMAIAKYKKELDAEFDDNISMWHQGHKAAVGNKRKYEEPAIQARAIVKLKTFQFEDEQDRSRRAEEARLQAEAQKKAEEEALEAAERAEKAGNKQEAEAIIQTPVAAPVVVLKPFTPKVPGHVRRTITKFRIVNEKLIPREYLKPDEVKINGVVRSLGLSANIPGVEVYEESV